MRTYIIKAKIDITPAMINVCLEHSIDTLRLSVDETLALLKWDSTEGSDPPIFDGETKYTSTELDVIFAGPEWTEELNQ